MADIALFNDEEQDGFMALFNENEKQLNKKLCELFCEWWEFQPDMTLDGFFPNYLNQRHKILFIGQESYRLENQNYIEFFYDIWQNGKNFKNSHILVNYIAYAVQACEEVYDNVLPKEELKKIFLSNNPERYSYAFMNLSKIRLREKRNAGSAADWKSIKDSVEKSTKPRNFIKEEIEILSPDIIITMNIADRAETYNWDVYGNIVKSLSEENVAVFDSIFGYEALVIDTYHFSPMGKGKSEKDKQEIFFDPVIRVINSYYKNT